MKTIVTSEQMQFCDNNTIQHFQVPSMVLMERAALAVVEQIRLLSVNKQTCHTLVVCGNGNNGADGLAIARMLYLEKHIVTVVQVGAKDETCRRSVENRNQRNILSAYGIPLQEEIPDQTYDIVLDALFGIGLTREPSGAYASLIQQMNKIKAAKIAVDMPSGVSADTGNCYSCYFKADQTVTFAFEKIGQILYPGHEACGNVIVAQIGITKESWLMRKPDCFYIENSDMIHLPKRPAYSNKGTFGKVLVISGSKGMSGAAFFCAKAAYRMGCGLVKIYTEESNRMILQQQLPEALLETYENELSIPSICDALEWADVIALGPGLGKRSLAVELVQQVMEHAKKPLIIDADGLNILASLRTSFGQMQVPVIITPHLGEMARLLHCSISQVREHLLDTAREYAKQEQVTCVLKDTRTLIACQNGHVFFNQSGSNALAKGGSGDILTGMIAALLAQGMDAESASAFGVYIHGKAGESVGKQFSCYGALASDVLNEIPQVLCEMLKSKS